MLGARQLEFEFMKGEDVGRAYDVLADSMKEWSWYNDSRVGAAVVAHVGRAGAAAIELCCGNGALLGVLASAFPATSWVGVDSSARMVELASSNLRQVANVNLAHGDWIAPVADALGGVHTIVVKNALHLVPNVGHRLAELARVVPATAQLVVVETVSPSEAANMWVRRLFSATDTQGMKKEFFTTRRLQATIEGGGWQIVRKSRIRQSLSVSPWLAQKAPLRDRYDAALSVLGAAEPKVRSSMRFRPTHAQIPSEMLRLQLVLTCRK
jgi:ubiquinone/menaquinone biosynthesis C-methylase UbiE